MDVCLCLSVSAMATCSGVCSAADPDDDKWLQKMDGNI